MSATVELPMGGSADFEDELRDVLRRAIPETMRDPVALAARLTRLDLYGLLVEARLGGIEAGLSSALLVVEELALSARADSYAHSAVLAPLMLRCFGPDPEIDDLLRDLAAGRRQAVALIAGAVDDRHLCEVEATGDGPVVSGSGPPLPGDVIADVLIVLLRDGHRSRLAVIPATAPGVEVRSVRDLTGGQRHRMVLSGVRLDGYPAIDVGRAELDEFASLSALVATAALVGAARRSRDLTLTHVRARQQFGRPLAAFQAVQMRCADLAGDVDSARSIMQRAVAAFDARRQSRHVLASMAVLWSAPACVRATQNAHLLHGALGFTAEYELHRHSVTALVAGLGANAQRFHQARVAGQILQNPSDWSSS